MINKRTKKCAICREPFQKRSSWQKVCNNPDCAQAYAEKERKKRERKELRERREKLKTKSNRMQAAQQAFNAFIRERDFGKPCICCGKPLENNSIGGGYDAGHYRSVGAAPHLRFVESNCHAQSKHCNRYLSGNAVAYRAGLIERIGIEEVERIESDNEPKKFTESDLMSIASEYKRKTREIRKVRGELCKIDGCGNPIDYLEQRVCQKHYFRFMRNGSYDKLVRTKRYRVEMDSRGYQRIYHPEHPLCDSAGYVAEHRKVVFDKIGYDLKKCELCGKPVTWDNVHIDHIDRNPRNNAPDNLRPLCRPCNTFRDYPPQHTLPGKSSITYDGITQTAAEWARDSRVNVSCNVILHRLKQGKTIEQALFDEKVTHNGKIYKKKRLTEHKHQRKNSIAIEINGIILTAKEWSQHEDCSVSDGTIRSRIKDGWDGYSAVFLPARSKKK